MPAKDGIEVRVLGGDEANVLDRVAPAVFDRPINKQWAAEFFADPRHHLAVAIDAGQVVGMASAVHYVNPDKPSELWINEVGVAPTHRRIGLGKRLLFALIARGQELGCCSAWVLTDRENVAAMNLYSASGGMEARMPSVMFSFPLNPVKNK